YENADKCAWTFGSEYKATNGSLANMKLGARDYLIQQNWVNAGGGYCALSYTATADFSLSVSPTSQSVTAGKTTGAYTMTATALNGWTGTVTYSVTSVLPSGATAIISGNSITIATSNTTPAGSYSFTISGTDGTLTHTTTAALVVTVPSFTISLSPGSTSVTRPGFVQYTITLAAQPGFNDNVGLSVSGARTGLTFSIPSPQVVTGGNGTSTFTATVTTSARKGTVTVTVTGKGVNTGIAKSASATLRIQ
ncbi:MAG TPA: hypothetical protein VLM42_13915, partial [Bryobacteraceae bacterium]|nr:hypothetical protein [Bryobacteraceae bacterium]